MPPNAETLNDLYSSPCCGVNLIELRCTGCNHQYALLRGVPVLIDFSRSIVDQAEFMRQEGESPIAREAPKSRGRVRSNSNDNQVAEIHIAQMIEELQPGSRVLVVGGATVGKGTERLYESSLDVVGIDIYRSGIVQVLADAHQIPFADGVFDAVIAQAVFEHVLDPNLVVAEIWRVLKPHGLVYAETPFLQQVHEGPYDFTRFTESGHRWLFRQFESLDSGVVAGPGLVLQWSIDYLIRGLFRSRTAGIRSRRLTNPARWLDSRIKPGYAVDSASCVFFFGRRSDRSLSPHEILLHYKGAQ